MKKRVLGSAVFYVFTVLALVCALLVVGCKPEEEDDSPPPPPGFPVGTWKTAADDKDFTINANLSFTCNLVISGMGPSKVPFTGNLAKDATMDPYEYQLKNMSSTDSTLAAMAGGFNDEYVDLTPNTAGTQFVLTSANVQVSGMMADTYIKQ